MTQRPSAESAADEWCKNNSCTEYQGLCVRGDAFVAGAQWAFDAQAKEIQELRATYDLMYENNSDLLVRIQAMKEYAGKLRSTIQNLHDDKWVFNQECKMYDCTAGTILRQALALKSPEEK